MTALLDKVSITNESLGVKEDSTGWAHISWHSTLEYEGNKGTFLFKTGLGCTDEPEAEQVLYSLLLERDLVENNLFDDFGIADEDREGITALIEDNNKKLGRIFSETELQKLEKELEDY